MGYSALHGRKLAHRQIRRLGGRIGAITLDGVVVKRIMLRVMDYSSRDRRGDLVDPLARRALISTYTPDGSDMAVVPNKEVHQIVLFKAGTSTVESTLRILAKPLPIEVAGIVTMWDLQVMQP
jgi:hypothetical protein